MPYKHEPAVRNREVVVSLFTGVRGYLDKLPPKEIPSFEAKWLEFVRTSQAEAGSVRFVQGTRTLLQAIFV